MASSKPIVRGIVFDMVGMHTTWLPRLQVLPGVPFHCMPVAPDLITAASSVLLHKAV